MDRGRACGRCTVCAAAMRHGRPRERNSGLTLCYFDATIVDNMCKRAVGPRHQYPVVQVFAQVDGSREMLTRQRNDATRQVGDSSRNLLFLNLDLGPLVRNDRQAPHKLTAFAISVLFVDCPCGFPFVASNFAGCEKLVIYSRPTLRLTGKMPIEKGSTAVPPPRSPLVCVHSLHPWPCS